MKKAVIVGYMGQDGRLLNELLSKSNYEIIGIGKKTLECFGAGSFSLDRVDINKEDEVFNVINKFKPDEIYYLASFHHSSEDPFESDMDLLHESYKVNVFGLFSFLEGIKRFSSKTKLFYAASSLIFGETQDEMQDEQTPFNPDSIYGITKLDGLLACRYFRNKYNIFASTGILYNHESRYRRENFISRKIIKGAVNIKNRKQDKLILGDLSSEVDWGFAPDYVDAMHRIMKIEKSDDFIIATGLKHSVLEFVKITFDHLGLDWRKFVEEDKKIITRTQKVKTGNPQKLFKLTGWQPNVNFDQMIKQLLMDEGVKLNGE